MSRLPIPALLLAASASFAAGPPAPDSGQCGGAYTVARGDTLYSIARRCRSSVVDIARASGLADPRQIEIGQRLVIPGTGAPASAESDKPRPAGEEVTLSYNFRPGDTIYSLARWSRVSVGALIAANPGVDPHKIEIGDNVRLPAGAASPEPARLRERGTGPGPAFVLRPPWVRVRQRVPVTPAPASPPRVHAEQERPAPPPPRRDKPESENEREPEGM